MKKLIVLSETVHDGLRFQSFQSLLDGFTLEGEFPPICPVAIDQNSFHTGFVLGNLVEMEERYGRPQNTIIYVDQQGASSFPFAVIRLATGLIVCGRSVGNCFSFITPKIHIMQSYKRENSDAFDAHPRILAQLMEFKDDEMLFEELHMNIIPQVRGLYIGHIANDGTVITTLTAEDLKGRYEYGENVTIKVNNAELQTWYEPQKEEQHHSYILVPSPYTFQAVPYLMIQNRSYDISATSPSEALNTPVPGQEISIT
ncbi:MAG: hypothetical protein ACOCXQ_00300 [Patescibacteria group bacterium]